MNRTRGTIHHLDAEVCDACGERTFAWVNPCMPCVKARHRAAVTHRCACPKRLKRPTEVKQIGSRRWIACERCLGTIEQLS